MSAKPNGKHEAPTVADSPLLSLVRAQAHQDPSEAILTLANVVEQCVSHSKMAENAAESADAKATRCLETLHKVCSALERIEGRLGTAEDKVHNLSQRGSRDEIIVEELARTALEDQRKAVEAQRIVAKEFSDHALEERRDEVQARKDHRRGMWALAGKAAAFIFSAAGAGLIISAVLRGCSPDDARGAVPDVEPDTVLTVEVTTSEPIDLRD